MKGSSKEVLMELEVGSVNDHPTPPPTPPTPHPTPPHPKP